MWYAFVFILHWVLKCMCSECGQAGASIKRYNVQVKHERNEKSYDKLNIFVRKCITTKAFTKHSARTHAHKYPQCSKHITSKPPTSSPSLALQNCTTSRESTKEDHKNAWNTQNTSQKFQYWYWSMLLIVRPRVAILLYIDIAKTKRRQQYKYKLCGARSSTRSRERTQQLYVTWAMPEQKSV